MQAIAIIGGGFSGTMTAVNLVRFTHIPLRIVIVNREYPTGRGIAYSTKQPEHLVNVAARNMSALADHPTHFMDWLRTRCEYADLPESELRETFVPRRVYGDYLRGLLQSYAVPVTHRDDVKIDLLNDDVLDVVIEAGRAVLILASGDRLEAEKVVLATGNLKPAEIKADNEPFRHPAYCENPWTNWEARLPDVNETVVLLGTGLTTVDALVSLLARQWRGTIYAVSRNGLFPQSHFRGIEYSDFPPPGFDPHKHGLEELADILHEHCRRLRNMGANPAIVVDKLRPFTQRIWKSFTVEDKQNFIRKYAPLWNVTRHRIAQNIHCMVDRAVDDGRLKIVTGRVVGLKAQGSRIQVMVRGKEDANVTLEAGFVVNGTGPRSKFSESMQPLFKNLIASGRLKLDDLDMGIEVDERFTAVEADGRVSPCLYGLGPMLKGSLWETIAVPELRGQALQVARSILEVIGGDRPKVVPWPSNAHFDQLEYCI
jgi:uncharacterized NAD(P)/FAD-binding protein YdhS